ncbi:14386_t:CDS:2, partial [Entrophospora sp. SA101]
KYLDIVNLEGIQMPTPICSRTFEKIKKQNPTISINVVWKWKEENCKPKPVMASKNLYLPNSCKIEGYKHPRPFECHEKRPHKIQIMVLSEVKKINNNNKENLISNVDREGLGAAPQVVTMPKKGGKDFEKFKNYSRMMYVPCVINADFECNHIKKDENYGGKMHKLAEQTANNIAITEEFVRKMDYELKKINEVLAVNVDKIINDEYQKKIDNADKCWICNGAFRIDEEKIAQLEKKSISLDNKIEELYKKKEDTSTLTFKVEKIDENIKTECSKAPIPVIIHNFRGYDSHLICQSVAKSAGVHQICVIAETFGQYKTMKVGQIKYMDSYQFMNSNKERCFGTLEKHKITVKHYKNYTKEQIAMVCQKGIYPYEYIDSLERFLKTELPPIEKFNSKLGRKIPQKEYDEQAQNIWKTFGCKNLGDYHYLYLKTDVLLLSDIWNTFCKNSMKQYKLDPSHYVSTVSLTWDAMLKMSGVEIELFTDISMHNFIEKAKRGANNPKMGTEFDPTKPTTWISYVNANNLYGWAMSQLLPIRNCKWEEHRAHLNAHFPIATHDKLKDLPPVIENIPVKHNWLITHLGPWDNYVIHYLELQYYVKLGLVIDEVYEILSFEKTNWLASYIKFNTEMRQKATNDFEKDFFKLMNNASYDSFIFMTETEDIYKDMAERPDLFDLNNSKVIGLFKDEFPNNVIAKSYQIRSKLYHYVLADKTTKSKHKGVV